MLLHKSPNNIEYKIRKALRLECFSQLSSSYKIDAVFYQPFQATGVFNNRMINVLLFVFIYQIAASARTGIYPARLNRKSAAATALSIAAAAFISECIPALAQAEPAAVP